MLEAMPIRDYWPSLVNILAELRRDPRVKEIFPVSHAMAIHEDGWPRYSAVISYIKEETIGQ